MVNAKNFNLFLIDGDVTGLVKCTISNWTGVVYKIPRNKLSENIDREHFNHNGVYMLFGKDEDGDDEVYIGQAGTRKNGKGILGRIKEHLRTEKFEFNEVVVITTQTDYLGPTEISYLENRLTKLALENGRVNVKNSNEPNIGNVTEEKMSELEAFIEYTKMTVGVLGYKLFVPILESKKKIKKEKSIQQEKEFFVERKIKSIGKVIRGKVLKTNEGFVVLKGSDVNINYAEHAGKPTIKIIDKLLEEGEIVEGKLQKDILFNSSSAATTFILGMSSSGKRELKNKDGVSLKELEK